MNDKTLKKLHKIQVEILDEVVRICNENNITYFLVGGTLLGAVRHKGFIPWDDDIDVGMLREDYDKFMKIAKEQLKEKFELDSKETNPKYYLSFAKIRNKNTIYEQDFQVGYDGPKGIWIDIFPLDETKSVENKTTYIQKKIHNSIYRILHYKNGFILGNKNNKIKKIIGKIIFLKHKTLLNIQDKVLKIQNNKNGDYIINLTSVYETKKETFKKSEYVPGTELEFEGDKYKVPKNYKKVLKQVYGDYMKIPSKEEIKMKIHTPVRIKFEEE